MFLYFYSRSGISYSYLNNKNILNILIPNTKCNNLVAKFIRFYLIEITLMVPLEFVLATSYDNLS